jgi:hypothetical protein
MRDLKNAEIAEEKLRSKGEFSNSPRVLCELCVPIPSKNQGDMYGVVRSQT